MFEIPQCSMRFCCNLPGTSKIGNTSMSTIIAAQKESFKAHNIAKLLGQKRLLVLEANQACTLHSVFQGKMNQGLVVEIRCPTYDEIIV